MGPEWRSDCESGNRLHRSQATNKKIIPKSDSVVFVTFIIEVRGALMMQRLLTSGARASHAFSTPALLAAR